MRMMMYMVMHWAQTMFVVGRLLVMASDCVIHIMMGMINITMMAARTTMMMMTMLMMLTTMAAAMMMVMLIILVCSHAKLTVVTTIRLLQLVSIMQHTYGDGHSDGHVDVLVEVIVYGRAYGLDAGYIVYVCIVNLFLYDECYDFDYGLVM